jgi:hypothetical protein
MGRRYLAGALAAAALLSSVEAQAQQHRDRAWRGYAVERPQPLPRRSRGPDLYSAPPGNQGVITATTPNQWGNLGGPTTGGGGGGGP